MNRCWPTPDGTLAWQGCECESRPTGHASPGTVQPDGAPRTAKPRNPKPPIPSIFSCCFAEFFLEDRNDETANSYRRPNPNQQYANDDSYDHLSPIYPHLSSFISALFLCSKAFADTLKNAMERVDE
jgi:hypothetical protein